VPPIPEDYIPEVRFWCLCSPRATVWHHMCRNGDKIVSLCGEAELTNENYWRMKDRKVSISMRHRTCAACDALHPE
jgi:hypothetical protein